VAGATIASFAPGDPATLPPEELLPVELLLDGRLIARGEVVVIDGNYGLRVTDTSPLGLAVGAGHGQ